MYFVWNWYIWQENFFTEVQGDSRYLRRIKKSRIHHWENFLYRFSFGYGHYVTDITLCPHAKICLILAPIDIKIDLQPIIWWFLRYSYNREDQWWWKEKPHTHPQSRKRLIYLPFSTSWIGKLKKNFEHFFVRWYTSSWTVS